MTILMTFLTFVAPLAAIGLVRGDMENAWDCCVVGNISENTWQLHAPALMLLVLPRKSNMLPDLSASVKRLPSVVYSHSQEQDSYGYQLEDVEENLLLLLCLLDLAVWPQGGLLEDYLPRRMLQCAVCNVQCAVCNVQCAVCK